MVAFDEVSTGDVELLLKDSTTKQCELDTAPVWLIKKLSSVFAPIIAFLVNTSIRCSTLPAQPKRAVIRPRIKKQGLDASDPGNYRPISNLSFISKFIERVIHRQLSTYAESKSLLPATQSGFRRSHSTETAVIKVYNDVVLALDSGLQTALLLLDFSAAFDCVDPRSAHSRSKNLFRHHIISTRLDQIISLKQNPFHQNRQQNIKTIPRQVWCTTGFNTGSTSFHFLHDQHCPHRSPTWYPDPSLCRRHSTLHTSCHERHTSSKGQTCLLYTRNSELVRLNAS